MYFRAVKTKGANNTVYEYIRLVEAYWEDGRSKQRVVANLGRKDLLAPHLDALVRLVRGEEETTPQRHSEKSGVGFEQAAPWGPALIARTLWQQLGLEEIFQQLQGRSSSEQELSLSDRILVLVSQRLCEPGSEHALASWLETNYVCDCTGTRLHPHWKQQGRVQVDLSWLQRWYRSLDELLGHKQSIERELFLRLRDLFALESELVFYDITSTYFEGHGPVGFARHGHSRDGKPRKRQVLVGVVMINGWPIAHHVFRGNLRDSSTVVEVLEDLEQRFGLKRVIFVGDRGMVTTENLEAIKKRDHGYLVGLQRRRREHIYELVQRVKDSEWIDCPVGITASEKSKPPKTMVQEVTSEAEKVRSFVVHSEEREEYERTMREKAMRRSREDLEKLAKRVRKGQIKRAEKIGQAAGRILTRNHGHRYYDWKLQDGVFEYFEHPVYLPREQAYEGKYLIQTEEQDLDPVEAVTAYKELCEIERGFREIKDILEMRPIFHRKKERAQAHIFVAALALLLDRALEKKLKAARVPLSAAQALKTLKTMHVVDITVDGEHTRGVTAGSKRAQQVLTAVGVSEKQRKLPIPQKKTKSQQLS
jgi:transposase